ncbi:GntR family transcriptional regulator [Aureimonas populi]|uniref:GntR family transcriptional regulator n=1 Tax=Aureimonas populi TaxID=1701758 RepID=A0ABW5CK18_9HYPH|nr:GntR family transcriptional regulator [Aureimonas populi]
MHDALLERIFEGRISPGDGLSEVALAEEFSVSRTPIREALHRLSLEGLVERGARRVFVVRRMAPEALAELFEAVGEVEALVARKAALRMSEMERQALRAIVAEGRALSLDPQGYAAMNTRFHAALQAGARNAILADLLFDLSLRTLPWRRAQFTRREKRLRSSQSEHEAILDAILKQDGEAAFQRMRAHVAASFLVISGMIDEQAAATPDLEGAD